MAAIDWRPAQRKYKGKWVAFLDDEITVVASGKTAKEAWSAAQKKGHKLPILFKFPLQELTFVGNAF